MRTGLAAEAPTQELSEAMDAVPVLREAFKGSPLTWKLIRADKGWALSRRWNVNTEQLAAPTVREMLAWLLDGLRFSIEPQDWMQLVYEKSLCDPDALARCCLAAAGGA